MPHLHLLEVRSLERESKRKGGDSGAKSADSMEFPGWIPTAMIVGHALGEMSIPVIVGNFMAREGEAHTLPLTVVITACIAFFLFYLLWFIATR